MLMFRLVATISLLATFSFSQSVIDTRGKAFSQISGYPAHVHADGTARGQKVLSGVLTISDPTNLAPGNHFDYELLVTNDSNASVVIPQSFDWKEIDDGQASQNFVQANMLLQIGCLKTLAGDMDHIVFYGSDERPGTEITLNVGESVRILGSGVVPIHPDQGCQSQTMVTFHVDFHVDAIALTREPKSTKPDAYTMEQKVIVVANGRKEYPITFPQ